MIRAAVPQDAPALWEMIQELARYEKLEHQLEGSAEALHRALFQDQTAECLVAEAETGLVGYALFFQTFSTFLCKPGIWLEDLYVTPSHRGSGVGKRLLAKVVEIARERGCGRVEWSVLDWNESAIGFYQGLGATVLPDWSTCRLRIPSTD